MTISPSTTGTPTATFRARLFGREPGRSIHRFPATSGRPGSSLVRPPEEVVPMRGCRVRAAGGRYTTEPHMRAGSCAPAVLTSSPTAGGAIIAALAAGSEQRRRYSEVA